MQLSILSRFRITLFSALLVAGCGTTKSTPSDLQSEGSGGATEANGGAAGQGDNQAGGAIDGSGGGIAGSSAFNLAGAAGALAATGEGTCISPYVLLGASVLPSESTAKASNAVSALSATCLGTETAGPEKIYKIKIPAAGPTKLKVTATPTQKPQQDAFDPVIYLTKSCVAHPTCASGRDLRGGGSHETLEYDNQSGSVQDMFVIIDGFDFQPQGGAYALDVSLSTP